MGLLEAHKDSNAASGNTDRGKVEASLKQGFVAQEYPSTGPAKSNDDLSGYGSANASLGQDGTAQSAYNMQPDTIDAKKGK